MLSTVLLRGFQSRVFKGLVLSLFTAVAASAQTPADIEGVTVAHTLANGLRCIVAPFAEGENVTVTCYLATGSGAETDRTRGAAKILAELWRSTTTEALTARGATELRFQANVDFVVARATWPKNLLPEAIEFVAAHWLRPDLRAFAAAKTASIAARDRRLKSAQRLFDDVSALAFPGSGYGVNSFGPEGALERISEADFADDLRSRVVPGNVIVIIAGRCVAAEAEAALRARLAELPRTPAVARSASEVPRGNGRRTLGGQSFNGVVVAFHKGPGADPTIAAWDILAEIWKGRWEKLVVAQRSRVRLVFATQAPGMRERNLEAFFCVAELRDDLPSLEKAIVSSADSLVRDAITPAEFSAVRSRLLANAQRVQSGEVGQHLADWLAMTGDWRSQFRYRTWVQSATLAEVQALANATFRDDNRVVVSTDTGQPSG